MLYFLYGFIIEGKFRDIIKYAIPYWLVTWCFYMKFGTFPLCGDEYNIVTSAEQYSNMNGGFTYLTTYFHMIALMLFPSELFVVFFKIVLSGIVVGYCIHRIKKIWNTKLVYLFYLLFLFPPSIELGGNVHRMPMYAMLYLFVACKLICDYKEKVQLSNRVFIALSILLAMLTTWRSEAFYLVILAPLLIFVSYRIIDKKKICIMTIVMLIVQCIVFFPHAMDTYLSNDHYNAQRGNSLFVYSICNMLKEGLDREEYREELTKINEFVSIEKIDYMNENMGERSYGDVYICFEEGYKGIKENCSTEDVLEFQYNVKKIILGEPLLYLKTQLKSWNYISLQYDIKTFSGLIKFLTGNLYFPTAILIVAFIYYLYKKQWAYWFITSAFFIHNCITTILKPAAYFKYYYHIYLFSGLLVVIWICKRRAVKANK